MDKPISERQYAYLAGRSTDAALEDLTRLLARTLEDKEIAVATFLDIEGAFTNASTESLVAALKRRGVPDLICDVIGAELRNRVVISSVSASTLAVRVGRGCPQGGVLSPLLWTLVVDELLEQLVEDGFHCLGYADDLAVVVRGKFAATVSDRTQAAINKVDAWCERGGLSVNPHKTKVAVYKRHRKLDGLIPPVLKGVTLSLAKEAKYLEVTFVA